MVSKIRTIAFTVGLNKPCFWKFRHGKAGTRYCHLDNTFLLHELGVVVVVVVVVTQFHDCSINLMYGMLF